MRSLRPVLVASALLSATALAAAQTTPPTPAISIMVKHAEIVRLQRPALTVIIADPTVADVTNIGNPVLGVLITGKNVGTTSLIILDEDYKEIVRSVVNVGRTMRIIAGGEVRNFVCNPGCGPIRNNIDWASLPAGSSLTTPVPGGGMLTMPVGGGSGGTPPQ